LETRREFGASFTTSKDATSFSETTATADGGRDSGTVASRELGFAIGTKPGSMGG
jgi:hypothetical protein